MHKTTLLRCLLLCGSAAFVSACSNQHNTERHDVATKPATPPVEKQPVVPVQQGGGDASSGQPGESEENKPSVPIPTDAAAGVVSTEATAVQLPVGVASSSQSGESGENKPLVPTDAIAASTETTKTQLPVPVEESKKRENFFTKTAKSFLRSFSDSSDTNPKETDVDAADQQQLLQRLNELFGV